MPSSRTAAVYADFLLPQLTCDMHLIDVGCGSGELSLELAAHVAHVTGIDDDSDQIAGARAAAEATSTANATFIVGDVYALPAPDDGADVVFGHSVLEALERPADALAEMRRVLNPNGLVAVASVEYGGLILGGPHPESTRRFFDIRERLWLNEGADPYRGRELRSLLIAGGFEAVEASAKYVSYGTKDAVREFGTGRADDCADDWYIESSQRLDLAEPSDWVKMRDAWLAWADSPDAYAAFAWCRATGRKATA